MSRYESAGYDDSGMHDCEQHHAALKLMKAVAAAQREMAANEGNRLAWQTRVDLASALTFARVWFGVTEDQVNEP